MKRGPNSIKEPLLDSAMIKRMPLMIAASVLSTFGWFLVRTFQGVPASLVQSETFTVLVVCQWFNVLNCRSATQSVLSFDILRNKWLIGGLLIANFLHFLVIYWPPLSQFFHTTPISISNFFTIGAVASIVLWAEEGRKLYERQVALRTTRDRG